MFQVALESKERGSPEEMESGSGKNKQEHWVDAELSLEGHQAASAHVTENPAGILALGWMAGYELSGPADSVRLWAGDSPRI